MKYELLSKDSIGLHRIRALKDFGIVKKGDVGGYVASEANLSQTGLCWVYDSAQVFGNAQVSDNACVSGNALVFDNACVSGNALVSGDAKVQRTYQCVSIAGLKYSLTSLPKGVQVGCKFYTLKEWEAKHVEVGLRERLTEEESRLWYETMLVIRRHQRLAYLAMKGKI